MNRPRPSILAQFDPLLSESEPEYVSDSGEEFDPEKENKAPELNELSMTAFFSRTYKRDYAQPAALTKRLVDIGDVTIVETVEEEENDENDENGGSENALFSLETPKRSGQNASAMRTPLAEITPVPEPLPKHSPSPLQRQRKFHDSPTQLRSTKPDSVSFLTSLVESVNLAGKNFGHVERAAPRITVESSLMATPAPFSLQASTSSQRERDEVTSNSPSLLAPPLPVTSSSNNRLSLDLHSSFNLQLQSETSFDLLNDRISFFDAEGGMFLNALDEDEDGGAESSRDDTLGKSPTISDDATPTPEDVQQEHRDSVIAKFEDLSLSSESEPSLESSALVFGPLINQPTSMVTPALHRTSVSTVPALRVVKRTKRYELDERASSATTTANSAPKRKPSPPLSSDREPSSAKSYSTKTSCRPDGPTRAVAVPVAAAVAESTAKARPLPKIGSNGPRRVLVSDTAIAKSSTGKPATAASTTAPGRPKVPLPSSASTPMTTLNNNGVKSLAAIPRPGGASGTGIPPPPSKLQAPSGIARFGRKASAPPSVPSADSGSRMPVRGLARRFPTYGPQ
ncbi:hypothetical protein BT96DRAFT_641266 [Gymnopus androsaceus JB14]|uniref:Uncharacterized protein n=1 Tax=Gymnopus androsaceus JB14 TaxID=1447944 RepID=A0A6A4HNF7_9AGAR|nr:hypothetical protein BT96DRAFT_641266 [Gymnopus androsaceus JB14]